MARLIVIGGVAAGMSAAAQAKRTDESFEVIVFEKGEHILYGACGMPYFLSDESQPYTRLVMLTPEKAGQEKGVSVRTLAEVEKIDVKNKKVLVKNIMDSSREEFYFDRLVIAAGAAAVVPGIKGIKGEKIFFLKTLNQGIKLKKYLYENKPKSAVLLAEGHIGLEAAENLIKAGVKKITIIAQGKHLCWWLDADVAGIIERRAEEKGIRIIRESVPSEISEDNGKKIIVTGDEKIKADFVFVSRGMKPESRLAEDAGIRITPRGAIDVNDYCETSVNGIYAAGDCANIYNIVRKEKIYMPRGTHANRQGRAAGFNAAGGKYSLKGITGVVVFKFLDIEIGRTGMSEAEAKHAKIDFESVMIKYVTRAGYYPGGKRIHIKLTADKKNRKVSWRADCRR